ncbi:hypothetical protein [Hoeflea sp.]|uniref:hypothetical protein n=1 Tax=Hoeflea sp. TaxID=1940281 RepID=UPI003B02D429
MPKVPLDDNYRALKAHVLDRINRTTIGESPFFHLYIDQLFPEEFFQALQRRMRSYKKPRKMQTREQDNPGFVNRRFPLAECRHLEIRQFQTLFEDADIKKALFRKFYMNPSDELVSSAEIHKNEFEFVFCEPERFQNIHVDIPPKYMSFVFYFPDGELSSEEEERNATVLYNKELKPVYGARFRKNSVCVFVPHFYSYHGFSTTVDRDVLVMFYINENEMKAYDQMRLTGDKGPEFNGIEDMIEDKLKRNPLIEYGNDPARIETERHACRINAPQGRVLLD